MLKPAHKYQTEINDRVESIFGDDKYKYYFSSGWHDTLHFESGNWYKDSKVSLDKDHNVIGFIQAEYNRVINSVVHLQLINFSEKSIDKFLFGKDVHSFFKELFIKYKISKINFSVCVGNPIEKSYDKLVNKLGGRIVGVYENEYKLWGQKLYDSKVYEITNPFLKIEKDN